MSDDIFSSKNDTDIKKYSELYRKFGHDERSLGWTKHKQDKRFENILKNAGNDLASVLDIGCGFGDLYSYLKRSFPNRKIDYTGLDVVPVFITEAREQNPDGKFIQSDLFEYDPSGRFDLVVECGCFATLASLDEDEAYRYIERFIGRMLELCTDSGAAVIQFLTDKVDYRTSEDDFHVSPEKLLKIAYGFKRRLILDNGVFPFEACLTIFKDDSFKPETTVFNSAYGCKNDQL